MKQAVTAGQQSSESVNSGIKSVKEADSIFESISASIETLSGDIKEISQNIQKMAGENQSGEKAIDDIPKVSTKSAAESQTVSAATQETVSFHVRNNRSEQESC